MSGRHFMPTTLPDNLFRIPFQQALAVHTLPTSRLRRTASNRDDDFTHLLVRLQVAVRLDDLVERERLGDKQLETAVSQPLIDKLRFIRLSLRSL